MKYQISPRQMVTLICAIAIGSSSQLNAQNLISNGDFESDPAGTSTGSVNDFVDSATITGWRVYSVSSGGGRTFSAQISDGTTPPIPGSPVSGTNAIRLDLNGTNTGGGNYALDRDSDRITVSFGTDYSLAFSSMKFDSPADLGLQVRITEFNGATFLGDVLNQTVALTDGAWGSTNIAYVPVNASVNNINIGFRFWDTNSNAQYFPGGIGAAAAIDNVSMTVVPEASTSALLLGFMALSAVLVRRRLK